MRSISFDTKFLNFHPNRHIECTYNETGSRSCDNKDFELKDIVSTSRIRFIMSFLLPVAIVKILLRRNGRRRKFPASP